MTNLEELIEELISGQNKQAKHYAFVLHIVVMKKEYLHSAPQIEHPLSNVLGYEELC